MPNPRPVDRVEIQILVDNATDILWSTPAHVKIKACAGVSPMGEIETGEVSTLVPRIHLRVER